MVMLETMPRPIHSELRQAILDRIDARGPVTTKQLMAEGLEPRAAHGLYVEGYLGVGARGYERPSEAPRTTKPPPTKSTIPTSCRVGYCLGKGCSLPTGVTGLIQVLPRRFEGALKRIFKCRDHGEVVRRLMELAIVEERAKHFGSSKTLRAMCDAIDGGELN